MHGTIKLFKTIEDPKFSSVPDSELCELYQNQLFQDPRILATMWLRHTGVIKNTSMKPVFYGIFTEPDIASYSLEEIDHCLSYFNYEKGTKFVTYYCTVLYRRLRMESQQLRCHKRKINFMTESIDQSFDGEHDNLLEGLISSDNYGDIDELISNLEVNDLLNELPLNDNERKYCNLLIQGNTNTEICQIMGKSAMTLSNWRKSIRNIFSCCKKEYSY